MIVFYEMLFVRESDEDNNIEWKKKETNEEQSSRDAVSIIRLLINIHYTLYILYKSIIWTKKVCIEL